MTSKKRRGKVKVTDDRLIDALECAISTQGSAELAILHLFNSYDFHLADLQLLLQEKGLDVSFSKVAYRDIAPRVGLDPLLKGNDMQAFDIHRARIPTSLFKAMVEDLGVVMNQYGEPRDHKNEEARSRFLAPLFNRTVALFKLTIVNTPESMIYGHITTRGRIEYYFLVFGRLSILVVEVKYKIGDADERLNAIAQVIAECNTCDYANDRAGFHSFLIYAVLCDGITFEFFSFDGKNAQPTFSRGVFCPPNAEPIETLAVAIYGSKTNTEFIFSLRPICETLFYFLLLAYRTGIQAYMERSVACGFRDNRPRESTPGWKQAHELACNALTLAVEAGAKAANRDKAANEKTEESLRCLQESLAAIPASHRRDIDLMRSWDGEGVEFC